MLIQGAYSLLRLIHNEHVKCCEMNRDGTCHSVMILSKQGVPIYDDNIYPPFWSLLAYPGVFNKVVHSGPVFHKSMLYGQSLDSQRAKFTYENE